MKKLLSVFAAACLSACIASTAFAAESTDASGSLKLDKIATYNSATGMVDITLESYTTGVVEEGKLLAADTVLVLDTSGSMAYDYKLAQIGTPMYGDYFKHPSGNYWGWYENGHLVDGKNPYVLLPDGTFAEAEYAHTDANNVEYFRVKGGSYKGTLFYPTMLTENIGDVPRQYSYPVYTLYSSTATRTVTVETGVPIFGTKFVYSGVTYYGWLQDSHGEPYIKLEDGSFVRAYYERTDKNKVEVFSYTDADTGLKFEFYPRLIEKDNGVKRAENLPVVQLYSGYNKTRMAALHDAVAEFLRVTAESNEGLATSAQSRVAIVQFSCDQHGGTAPTKILRNLTAITKDNVDEWISFVYGIVDGGAHTHTEIGDGLMLAEDIIEGVTRTSHKAVVAFTDGKPECDETSGGGFSFIQTEKAISTASRLINNHAADVYAVCIQDHAKVNAGGPLPPKEGKGVNDDKNNINRFMHLMSSNYPNATSMDSAGTGSTSAGYYMVPGEDSDLTDIFAHIGDQIGSATINLGANAYVLDCVTPYFSIPAGASIDISVMDAVYAGGTLSWKESSEGASGISCTVDEAAGTVKVTGFDYNHNFVASVGRVEGDISQAGDFHGRKLVIKFSVKVADDFLGGDDVVTNEAVSGIYSDSSMVKEFPVPVTDVEVKTIEPVFSGGMVYLSQAAELPHVANIGHFKVDGVEYAIDGVNNAYVDIKYTISDGDSSLTCTIPAGTKYADLKIDELVWAKIGSIDVKQVLTGDKTYDVRCDVVSTNNKANSSSAEEAATIKVYKPEIAFKDTEILLGEAADYDENLVGVVWKDSEGAAPDAAALAKLGDAPQLSFEFSPVEGKFADDTDVKVTKVVSPKTARSNGFKHEVPSDLDLLTVENGVTFFREKCASKGCGNAEKVEVSAAAASRVNFVVHVPTFDLTISKTGVLPVDDDAALEAKDELQTAIFTVSRGGDFPMSMDVAVHVGADGSGSVVVKGLPVALADYTVAEKSDWSWRYAPRSATATVEADAEADGAEPVSFANDRAKPFWLSGDNYKTNVFAALAAEIQ